VNVTTWKLTELKTHDYHIIIKVFMLVVFWGYLDDAVWMVLADLS
jgi:hypothetical protein